MSGVAFDETLWTGRGGWRRPRDAADLSKRKVGDRLGCRAARRTCVDSDRRRFRCRRPRVMPNGGAGAVGFVNQTLNPAPGQSSGGRPARAAGHESPRG